MPHERPRNLRRLSVVASDVLPGVVVAGLLVALVAWDPALTGRLVREDQLVEWLQVLLAMVALGFVLASAARRLSPGDIVLAALLALLAAFEISLDRRLFGTPVFDARFFRLQTVPWLVQALVWAVMVGAPLTLLVYATQRWRELRNEARDGLRQGWLRLLIAGLVLYGVSQPWEHELNHLLPLPRYFLEEALELVGVMYLALAMRRRALRRSPLDGPLAASR